MSLHVDAGQPTRAPVPPDRRHVRRNSPRSFRTWLDLKAAPYLLVSPYYLLFLLFGLFPLGFTLYYAFFTYDLTGTVEWTGVGNFTGLLSDSAFWKAVVNTLGMFAIATVPQMLLALLLADALNKRFKGQLFVRMGVLLPLVTSVVAVAVVFTQLYGRDWGLINWVLSWFGADPVSWKTERIPSWLAIATMIDWRWTGYNAIIFLAGMQTIPRDLYEAASIDGASRRRQFWQITVPMLRPTMIFVVLNSTIGGLTLFAEPTTFYNGNVHGGTDSQFQTVSMFIFEQGFREFDYGYASAAAWLLFLLILIGSLINFLLVRRIGGNK
ncbi:carbohydrate ABC transporter permease [Sphaerimonospora thailandensis]|uniref:Sugar ABC transporter permease n=1 Tax=Sphaerimonospora thailandensis TaxID=795644 RepID=A0A8J3R3I7_9ACTN|nr:sugar ABC transporter permease [Sphaerimonospora thailandensis]GIH68437.1 sugar ABC transporter permease [Sphaerimonospora thailandensis]